MSVMERISRFSTPERALKYPVGMAILFISLYLSLNLFANGHLNSFGTIVGSDYLSFYTGGSFLREDTMEYLYDFDKQKMYQDELFNDLGQAKYVFISPPYAAFIFYPLALIDYLASNLIWTVIGFFLIAVSVKMLKSELSIFKDTSVVVLVGCCFLYFPTIAWLAYGQATPILLLIYVATFCLLRQNRDFSAGLCWGLLAFKPQLAMGLALVLIIKWRWRALVGGGVMLSIWLGAGFLVFPDAMYQYIEFSQTLIGFLRNEFPLWGEHSVFGFSALFLDSWSVGIANFVAISLTLIIVGTLSWCWWFIPWEPGSKPWDLMMATTFAWGIILSPHLFIYDLTLLLLPFAIVLNRFPGKLDGYYLEGGPLLAWTVIIWWFSLLGHYLTKIQQNLLNILDWPVFAIQFSTIAIFIWGLYVLKNCDISLGIKHEKSSVYKN